MGMFAFRPDGTAEHPFSGPERDPLLEFLRIGTNGQMVRPGHAGRRNLHPGIQRQHPLLVGEKRVNIQLHNFRKVLHEMRNLNQGETNGLKVNGRVGPESL
jgi:hypothetical protein